MFDINNTTFVQRANIPTPIPGDQVVDSVTQPNVKILGDAPVIDSKNVKVLGDAPAIAMGNLYQATGQALSNAAHNATAGQQQTTVTAQVATTMGVALLYSIDTASTCVATEEIFQ